jgi:tetratricopeptide (TPR) repeat protein
VLMGDIDGALVDAQAAHDAFASLAAHDTSDAVLKWQLAKSDRQVAQALLERGDAEKSLAQLHAGDAEIARALAKNPADPYMVGERMLAGISESRTLLALGRARDALTAAQRASAASTATLKEKPDDIETHRAAADASVALGAALSRSGDARGAHDAWVHAIALEDSITRVDPETELIAVQASALLHLGEREEAKPLVDELAHRGYRRPTFVRLVRESSKRD